MQSNINRNKKALFGWTMYDWANSVYALAVTTAIFPTYYSEISKSSEVMVRMDQNMSIVRFLGFELPSVSLYSYALSFSYFMIVFLSPILGAMADYSGSKKKFMFGFCSLGSLSCALLYFFDAQNYSLGIILFVLAALGFAGGNIFNDAFLPEVAEPHEYAKVSARGFMMGYIGSVIQLIICLVLIMKFSMFGFSSSIEATKLSFVLVGIWWFGFAQITFANLKDTKPEHSIDNKNIFKESFIELGKVLNIVKKDKKMKGFLISFLFYNMGIQTVLYMASLFGTEEIHLKTPQLIMTVLIIQLVAIVGSQVFAKASEKLGNVNTLLTGIAAWIAICVVAFYVKTAMGFYVLAGAVGFIMGGMQALSRATYSLLIPPTDDNASFFSFYSITDKVSIILGLLSYGWINQITGNM
ncbi:MFS transporter, partial [bacterium]